MWRLILALLRSASSEESSSVERIVRVFPEPQLTPAAAVGPTLAIQDVLGRAWSCRIGDKAGSEVPAASSAYDDLNGTLPRLASIQAYVQHRSTSTRCLESPKKTGLYWSYELCPGSSARQFRRRRVAATGTPSVVKHDGESHSLGRFVEEQATATADKLEAMFPGLAGSELKDGIVVAPARLRGALVERYVDGDGSRSATVYVACLTAEVEFKASGRPPSSFDSRVYEEVRIARVVEEPLHTYHLLVAAPRQMCARTELADMVAAREIKRLATTCLQHKPAGDYWTYEVCVSVRVRQFRANDNDNRHPGYVVGLFDGDDPKRKSRDEPSPERVQHYSRGDACDITGRPRAASVKYACAPRAASDALLDLANKPAIVAVVERATCEYDITVALPAVCAVLERGDGVARGLKHIDCSPSATGS